MSLLARLSYCEYRNSRDVPPPTEAELRAHLQCATGWIFANTDRVSHEDNPMLLLFLRDAARPSNDARLSAMASEYQTRYVKGTTSWLISRATGSSSGKVGGSIPG